MKYEPVLKKATFLRRYKRFLADVVLDGVQLTVHCPNTGSMRNCMEEGSDCWLSDSKNPKRKYRYTWELATTATGDIAGINTLRANPLVEEALNNGVIAELPFESLRREVPYGEGSRVDFLLQCAAPEGVMQACYVEVKSVTLGLGQGLGVFPDAPSERARKHLQALMAVKRQGARAVLLYCVQHNGIRSVAPADDVDPRYGVLLRQAYDEGVEIIAYAADLSAQESVLTHALPVIL